MKLFVSNKKYRQVLINNEALKREIALLEIELRKNKGIDKVKFKARKCPKCGGSGIMLAKNSSSSVEDLCDKCNGCGVMV